jgi:ABC-type transport system involved in multi-copper enzyme maturation permease subunit
VNSSSPDPVAPVPTPEGDGRRTGTLIGPLFWYDLVRLARRGRSTLLRCTYALFLLLALYAVYDTHFPQASLFGDSLATAPKVPANQMAHFSANFAIALIALQVLAVVVLTPAYLAGAIAEEREKRTLELLFTTRLTDREIILGKLFGRLSHLAGILLTGLPILSLLQLWGGVDGSVLLAGSAVTVMTLLSVGSVSILFSSVASSSLNAVLASYITVALVTLGTLVTGCLVVSPLGFVLELEHALGLEMLHRAILGPGYAWNASPSSGPFNSSGIMPMTLTFVVLHGVIASVCLTYAVTWLRDELLPRAPTQPSLRPHGPRVVQEVVMGGWEPAPRPRSWDEPMRPRPTHAPDGYRHPVTDSALLWKEALHGAGELSGLTFAATYARVVGVGLVLCALVTLANLRSITPSGTQSRLEALVAFSGDTLNPVLSGVGAFLAAAWCIAAAWQNVGSITREREQRTLAGLLVLPTSRAAILGAKWLGGPLRYRFLGFAVAGVWTVGLLTAAFHPVAVLLLALATAIHLASLSSLGVWLSLASRNTFWAYLTMALMLMLVFSGSWIVLVYSELLGTTAPREGWWDMVIQVGLNPGRAWSFLGLSWAEFPHGVRDARSVPETLGAVAVSVGAFAALGGLLWWASWQRFRDEQPPSA